jgi:hypothetical protein
MLRKTENSWTDGLMFRWQDMIIYLDMMLGIGGKKYLLVTVENAGAAGLTLDGNTARWITYGADGEKGDALVCTTSAGPASPATEPDTCK